MATPWSLIIGRCFPIMEELDRTTPSPTKICALEGKVIESNWKGTREERVLSFHVQEKLVAFLSIFGQGDEKWVKIGKTVKKGLKHLKGGHGAVPRLWDTRIWWDSVLQHLKTRLCPFFPVFSSFIYPFKLFYCTAYPQYLDTQHFGPYHWTTSDQN